MGGLLTIFGDGSQAQGEGSGTVQITEHDRAMLELKTQRDTLKRYIKKVSDREVVLAKALVAQQKRDKAKLCLQKKKFQEQLIKRAEDTLANVEEMVNTLEFTSIEKKVFDSLKIGSQTLKELQKEMSVEAVEEILLDTEEAVAVQKEIGNMLREKLTDEDEEEILQELAALTSTEDAPLDLPDVPRDPIRVKETNAQKAPPPTAKPAKVTRVAEPAQ